MINLYRRSSLRITRSVKLTTRSTTRLKESDFSRNLSTKVEESENNPVESTTNDEDTPWYLREDTSSSLIAEEDLNLPSLPPNAPDSLQTFMTLMAKDYGLKDILIFDLTAHDEEHTYSTKNQVFKYILIGSGKSEKHCFKAATELRHLIKHEHNILPKIEGMVSAGVSAVMRRRMLKNARKGPSATENDYGKNPNSWIMFDSGIDQIQIHILTENRRQELNLEELWCLPQDSHKFERPPPPSYMNDDIFIGLRRLHTMSSARSRQLNSQFNSKFSLTPFTANLVQRYREYSSEVSSLEEIYDQFLNEDLSMSEERLQDYYNSFNSNFVPSSNNYDLKFKFYKLVHILNSKIVKFDDLKNILYTKHASLALIIDPTNDLEKMKVDDVIEYTKLLLDSPEINESLDSDPYYRANILFKNLSEFLTKFLQFSDTDLLKNDEFISLLWRFTFIENEGFIGPKKIDEFINHGYIEQSSSGKLTELGYSRTRDLLDLVASHTKNKAFSNEFKELILFTYGNSNYWNSFWNRLNYYYGFLNWEENGKQSISKWVRLTVYLAARNDKKAMIYFLNNVWEKSSSLTRSVLDDLKEGGNKFHDDKERIAFKLAMNQILKVVETKEGSDYSSVQKVIDTL